MRGGMRLWFRSTCSIASGMRWSADRGGAEAREQADENSAGDRHQQQLPSQLVFRGRTRLQRDGVKEGEVGDERDQPGQELRDRAGGETDHDRQRRRRAACARRPAPARAARSSPAATARTGMIFGSAQPRERLETFFAAAEGAAGRGFSSKNIGARSARPISSASRVRPRISAPRALSGIRASASISFDCASLGDFFASARPLKVRCSAIRRRSISTSLRSTSPACSSRSATAETELWWVWVRSASSLMVSGPPSNCCKTKSCAPLIPVSRCADAAVSRSAWTIRRSASRVCAPPLVCRGGRTGRLLPRCKGSHIICWLVRRAQKRKRKLVPAILCRDDFSSRPARPRRGAGALSSARRDRPHRAWRYPQPAPSEILLHEGVGPKPLPQLLFAPPSGNQKPLAIRIDKQPWRSFCRRPRNCARKRASCSSSTRPRSRSTSPR